MDSIGYLVATSDEDSEDEVMPMSIPKYFHSESNPLDMTNERFMKLFRLTKECFQVLLSQTERHFTERNNIDAIPPILKLSATLRFLAEESYQQVVGQDFVIGMPQPTISEAIDETLKILVTNIHAITSVNPRYGGYSQDSEVWNMSKTVPFLKEAFLSGDKSSWILGDSGYTLQPWCMTPYRKALKGSRESRYNTLHSRARSIIERVLSVLKGRWRCLLHARELHYKPEKVAQIVNVCCLLHNLCIQYNVPIDPQLLETEEHIERNAIKEVDSENLPNEARKIRDEIRDSL